jgi:hypothetical protein
MNENRIDPVLIGAEAAKNLTRGVAMYNQLVDTLLAELQARDKKIQEFEGKINSEKAETKS